MELRPQQKKQFCDSRAVLSLFCFNKWPVSPAICLFLRFPLYSIFFHQIISCVSLVIYIYVISFLYRLFFALYSLLNFLLYFCLFSRLLYFPSIFFALSVYCPSKDVIVCLRLSYPACGSFGTAAPSYSGGSRFKSPSPRPGVPPVIYPATFRAAFWYHRQVFLRPLRQPQRKPKSVTLKNEAKCHSENSEQMRGTRNRYSIVWFIFLFSHVQ
jgi:hypothetical protein